MPSTYTTDLAIQLMATGENAGTWGQITNTNLVLLQQAIAGFETVNIAGGAKTTALAMTQNALSNARNASLLLSGTITGNQIVTIPAGIEKTYIVKNGTSGAFTVEFKPVGGTGATWTTTDKGIKILYSDGTNITTVDLSTLAGTVASASIANNAVTTAKLDTSAVTAVKITQSTITQAKLAANSVGANQIVQSTITQSKLAADSVGPNQLQATAVSAGTYTAATITVDADGRITSASSGSGGAGAFIPALVAVGPASGTFTAAPTANRLGVYMVAGGGGAGTGTSHGGDNYPNSGGQGGFGFYNKPITQPFSQPYSVGTGGAGRGWPFPGGGGSPGNATSFTNVGTVNAGAGAPTNTSGSSGSAPGASLTYPFPAFVIGDSFGSGGSGQGGSGSPGVITVFQNTGT